MNNNAVLEIGKIKSDHFFHLIKEMTNDIEVEILKVQRINNVLSLLRSQDLFSIFKIDCEKLKDLRNHACLQLKNGEYMIRPAIKENLDYCINVLKNKLPQQQPYFSENQKQDSNTESNYFVNTFIDNISDNMNRSKHRYQYNTNTRRFASSVYALENKSCDRIEEGEFRFDEFTIYSKKINCSYIYASEECTGVISKVQYDVATNSFVGFCPELINGIPMLRQYQTDDFLQL
ncbi:unnamed protein product [Rotaria sp. Silwood2]|nr:unnamed protein product [Rotaria sp. Silwood2]